MRFGVLDGPSEVELPGAQNQPILGDSKPSETIGLFDIQHDFFVDKKFVVKGQIVAVGIAMLVCKWAYANVRSQSSAYLFTGKNHGESLPEPKRDKRGRAEYDECRTRPKHTPAKGGFASTPRGFLEEILPELGNRKLDFLKREPSPTARANVGKQLANPRCRGLSSRGHFQIFLVC
jgi:hypothetical protein